jgi:hypothetical protein
MKNLFLMALLCAFMLACSSENKKEEAPISDQATSKVENTPKSEENTIDPIESAADDLNQKTEELSNDLDSLINEI